MCHALVLPRGRCVYGIVPGISASARRPHEVNKPLVVEDVEVLEPGAHEGRVKWAANGVCHSDLHVMTGDYP